MIIKYDCKNNTTMRGEGLDISVEGMSILIQAGKFSLLQEGKDFIIEDTEILLDVDTQNDRLIGVFLTNDIDNPIKCVEEIGKVEEDSVTDIIYTMARFTVPANCSDLSTLDIQVWQYKDIPEVINNEGETGQENN